jgi:hypothetical protein
MDRTYVRVMDLSRLTTDTLEQRLVANRELISLVEAEQLIILEEVDARQVATGDGYRSLSDWVAARLDLSSDTARSLVRTMRRTAQRPDLRDALTSGVSFDRVEALSRIPETVGLMEHLDVSGVAREAAKRAGVSAGAEVRNAENRFLVLQPSLDESWWKLWGGLDGHAGAIIDKLLSEAADQLPAEGQPGNFQWRRATALVQLCVSDEPAPAQVTVMVDAAHAVATKGAAGVVLEAGPTVGRRALEAVLCDAVLEVTARTEDGQYMDYGHRARCARPVPSTSVAPLPRCTWYPPTIGVPGTRYALTQWVPYREAKPSPLVPPPHRGPRTRVRDLSTPHPWTSQTPDTRQIQKPLGPTCLADQPVYHLDQSHPTGFQHHLMTRPLDDDHPRHMVGRRPFPLRDIEQPVVVPTNNQHGNTAGERPWTLEQQIEIGPIRGSLPTIEILVGLRPTDTGAEEDLMRQFRRLDYRPDVELEVGLGELSGMSSNGLECRSPGPGSRHRSYQDRSGSRVTGSQVVLYDEASHRVSDEYRWSIKPRRDVDQVGDMVDH